MPQFIPVSSYFRLTPLGDSLAVVPSFPPLWTILGSSSEHGCDVHWPSQFITLILHFIFRLVYGPTNARADKIYGKTHHHKDNVCLQMS